MADVDMSQVDRLARDLEAVPAETLPKFKKVVEKGAVNIKQGMRADATGHRTYPYFFRSINYDIKDQGLGAEIGPDKDMIQGDLGNLLYFGRSKTAPVLDINGPLHKETPRFEGAIGDVAEDIL
ncbi:hypothetical protein [Amycolatopsis echigonensis]|uniref:Uncharacterized protein n=1 Tax=Amycolatopsis echigonensis TaxID=2576905 RepID=A0A8E2B8H1_9PSEU|nr:hypothetical protein [Amycolatopsis echigonensis]MBB2504317.1 hypothetical protein [Amycolatopsis echigonensis]